MVKVRFWLLAFLLVAFGLFSGRELRTQYAQEAFPGELPREVETQAKRNLPPRKRPVPQIEKEASAFQSVPSVGILAKGQGLQLSVFLFDQKSLQAVPFEKAMEILKKRFQSPYNKNAAKHRDPAQVEAGARLGILRALQAAYPWEKLDSDERKNYISFHKGIALNKNEKLLVQAQAVRNLRLWISSLNDSEKSVEQNAFRSHLLFLASKTHAQMAREALGDYE